MYQNLKVLTLGVGLFAVSAKHQLTNPNAYFVAGAVGLGGVIGGKSLNTGITSGALAMLGIIGYTAINNVDEVVELAMEKGIL